MNKKNCLIALLFLTSFNTTQTGPIKNIAIISTVISATIGSSYIAYQRCNDASSIKKRVRIQKDYLCNQCIDLLAKAKSSEDNNAAEILRGRDEEQLKAQMLKELRKASQFIRQQKDVSCDYMIRVLQRAKSSPEVILQDRIESGFDKVKDATAKVIDNAQKQTQSALDKINHELNKPKK